MTRMHTANCRCISASQCASESVQRFGPHVARKSTCDHASTEIKRRVELTLPGSIGCDIREHRSIKRMQRGYTHVTQEKK